MVSPQITANDFLARLKLKVSDYNARLTLHTAMVDSKISCEYTDTLTNEQFESLCLGLIKVGGPAFHVGSTMYKELKTTIKH